MSTGATWTLDEVAAGAAARFGDRPALVLEGDRPDVVSFGELDRRAGEVAGGLRRLGIGPGRVVGCALPGGAEWLVLAVAVDRLGATFAPVSTALAPPERAAALSRLRPALVVADPSTADGWPLRTPVVVAAPGRRLGELAADDAGPGHGAAVAPGSVRRDADDVALVCCTSGTTGTPKAAAFGLRQVEAVQRIDLGPDAGTRWDGGGSMLASTHLAHVGMALKLPWYLRTGATLHVLPRWRADDALRLVDRHRMATLGVVAPQLALMLRSPLLDELDLSCVTTIVAGGAASPPALVEAARRRFGAAYSIRWSSTESGGVGLATPGDVDPDGWDALHTVGRPRPGVEARVAGDDDGPLGDGEVGELQLRSDAVMSRHLGDPTATATALAADGWLRTGDLARRRASGCYELTGRRSDVYVRGGYNVHPAEVEAVLGRHPDVADVAVVGTPDEVMGELGVAVVVPADPARPPDLAALRDFAAGELAHHKLPEDLRVVDRLPLTPAQKLDRAALASRLAGETGDDSTEEHP